MKFYIKAFAMSKSNIKQHLINKSPTVMEHLIKVWLYPDVVEQNHWKHEIATALNTIPVLKSKHRRPDSEFIYTYTFDAWKETIPDFIERVCEDMAELPISYNISDVYDAESDYFSWLSDRLSSGSVSNQSIYSEIETIRNRYFK